MSADNTSTNDSSPRIFTAEDLLNEPSLYDIDDAPHTTAALELADNLQMRHIRGMPFTALDRFEISTLQNLSRYADRDVFEFSFRNYMLIHDLHLTQDLVSRFRSHPTPEPAKR